MRESKRRRVEAKGWKVGTVAEFLELSEAESQLIELRLMLSRWLRVVRQDQGLTQHGLAAVLRSSQSRVAKMEAGDPSVTLDLLVRALVALGATAEDLALVITGKTPAPPRAVEKVAGRRASSQSQRPSRQTQRRRRAA